jgi:hypothetical protein
LRELRAQYGLEDRSRDVVSISSRRANETKASRREEWKRFPVKEPKDLKSWWLGVVGENSERENHNIGGFVPSSQDLSKATAMAQDLLPPKGDALLKSTQLVRQMNHVYY